MAKTVHIKQKPCPTKQAWPLTAHSERRSKLINRGVRSQPDMQWIVNPLPTTNKMHTHTHTHACTRTCTHMHTRTHVRTHTHACAHTYTHTYTHMHQSTGGHKINCQSPNSVHAEVHYQRGDVSSNPRGPWVVSKPNPMHPNTGARWVIVVMVNIVITEKSVGSPSTNESCKSASSMGHRTQHWLNCALDTPELYRFCTKPQTQTMTLQIISREPHRTHLTFVMFEIHAFNNWTRNYCVLKDLAHLPVFR